MVEVIIKLLDDGSMTMEGQGAAALWCMQHGKALRVALANTPDDFASVNWNGFECSDFASEVGTHQCDHNL